MKPESVIQQLFAIERSIGYVTKDELRSMVIEAQETALAAETSTVREIEVLRHRLEDSRRYGSQRPSRFSLRRFFRSKRSGAAAQRLTSPD
jgi:hypothetical protein